MTHPLRVALQRACGPNQKAVALDVYPEASPGNAEAALSKVLSGTSNIPPELFDRLLQGRSGPVLLDYFCGLAGAVWEPAPESAAALRQRALGLLEEMRDQLTVIQGDLERADAIEPAASGREGMA